MVKVFDLITGETETLSRPPAQPADQRPRESASGYVMPRLQEQEFTAPEPARGLPRELADADAESFVRAMAARTDE